MSDERAEIEAELRRVYEEFAAGKLHLSELAFPLKGLIRKVDTLLGDIARAKSLPQAFVRGRGVLFPIDIEEGDVVRSFSREEAEALYLDAMKGASLSLLMEEVLDIYEITWRSHRRQYGIPPTHAKFGEFEAKIEGKSRKNMHAEGRPTEASPVGGGDDDESSENVEEPHASDEA